MKNKTKINHGVISTPSLIVNSLLYFSMALFLIGLTTLAIQHYFN